MLDLSLKMTVAIAVAWLLTRGVTPRNAAAAHRLWLAALATPLLALAGRQVFSPIAYAQLRQGAWPEGLLPAASLTAPLFWFYAAVAGMLVLRVAAGAWRVRALVRGAARLNGADRARLPAVDMAGAPVLESVLDVPVTAGFTCPAVLLPRAWRALPADALTAILRHEAAHVRRRDGLVLLVVSLLEAVFWFNPLIWLAGANVRWHAEMACDGEAAVGMAPDGYATQLLQLAEGWRGLRTPRATLTLGAASGIPRRIALLLDEAERGAPVRVALPVAACVLVVMAPVSAAVQLRPLPPANDIPAFEHVMPPAQGHGRHRAH